MLRVATWNVLAPEYAVPARYAGVAPEDLGSDTRVPRVHACLTRLLASCDVVAVQEADPALVTWLGLQGISSVVQMRNRGRDGVALATTRHRFEKVASARSSDGRRCWVAAMLDDVLVACAHLDPEWSERGLHGRRQVGELVAWLGLAQASKVVLLADLNATWDSEVGRTLSRAGFVAATTGATAATNGRCRTLDVVAARGLHARADDTGLPAVGSELWLPDADVPSDHAPLVATLA